MASTTINHGGVQPASAQLLFPFLDLQAQFASIKDEINSALAEVVAKQHFILGPEVERFESEIADYTNAEFAIGCASGSDALLLALMALSVGPGDEVVTTPFTFVATAGAIARLNARPVFVDIEPATFNIDVNVLGAALSPRTRAIIPVHLFGLSANMEAINEVARDAQVSVVEDAAQAIGATFGNHPVGTIGTVGCFSFFPSKNLGCFGDGGMMTTNSPELATRLRLLRVHGSRKRYEYEILGINSRLDAIQAAILRVKLRYLDRWTEGRRANAEYYKLAFKDFALDDRVALPNEPAGYRHVYNQFVIQVERRDALRTHLQQAGIPTEIYYPSPLHLQPAFEYLGYRSGDFPVAEKAAATVLALPIYPELRNDQQRAVVQAIADFYQHS